jgi:GNAT superfamily N-acetyltransferase
MRRELDGRLSPSHAMVTFAPIAEEEAIAWAFDPTTALSLDHVRDAFARNDLCIGAFAGEQLVGYVWLSDGPTPHVAGLWVDFELGSHYAYKLFVRPEYRGKRIASGLLRAADHLSIARGIKRSIAIVGLRNHSSTRSFVRSGYDAAGYAGLLRCLGLRLAFRSPSARRAGFQFILRDS